MNHFIRPTYLVLLVSLAVPAIADEELEKGKVLARKYHFEEADKDMTYALFVPKSYDKTKKTPLIVALHGLYGNPNQIIRYPGLTTRADKHGYIVVAPMGYNSRGWYGSRGKGGRNPSSLGELSEKDVLNVLKIVEDSFNIDKNRVYLYGHSMGGGGSIHFALKYPNRFAAVAPMAPAIYRSTRELEKAKHVPFIVVQGAKDVLVKASTTRRWIEKMKELKMTHQYIEDPEGGHVRIAWEHFDEIFEFFGNHSRKSRAQKTKDGSTKANGETKTQDKPSNSRPTKTSAAASS